MNRLVAPAKAGAQFLALALSLPLAALANGLDDFLAFNSGTKTATARFEQQVFDRAGKTVERAEGTFAFARPGKFRWTYDKPHKQVLVGDGAKLWIHDPDLNQVTVKRMDGAISSTPAALLAGKDDITALFTLKDAGTSDGLAWVEATPKAQDTSSACASVSRARRSRRWSCTTSWAGAPVSPSWTSSPTPRSRRRLSPSPRPRART
jgi:outer membrane lipoprotein-sorting protein